MKIVPYFFRILLTKRYETATKNTVKIIEEVDTGWL